MGSVSPRALNRLLSASIPNVYSHSWTYNAIGNILTRNDNNGNVSYSYNYVNPNNPNDKKPHAVTQVGTAFYCYDLNGNLTRRKATTSACANGDVLSYDAENRLTSITVGANTTTYLYDGDGRMASRLWRIRLTDNRAA